MIQPLARRRTQGRKRAQRARLSGGERRRELLRAAAALMTRQGFDAVQFPEVARAAGVTRQLVYKFFPNRHALILAVLTDFADDLTQRFGNGAARALPGNVPDATRVFIEAVCDTIEAKGAGPWRLLDARGADAAVARLGREMEDRLLAPWHARIAVATGASKREVTALARMIAAAGRAVLELWSGGVLTRAEAVRDATRGVTALLDAFQAPRPVTVRRPQRRRNIATSRSGLA